MFAAPAWSASPTQNQLVDAARALDAQAAEVGGRAGWPLLLGLGGRQQRGLLHRGSVRPAQRSPTDRPTPPLCCVVLRRRTAALTRTAGAPRSSTERRRSCRARSRRCRAPRCSVSACRAAPRLLPAAMPPHCRAAGLAAPLPYDAPLRCFPSPLLSSNPPPSRHDGHGAHGRHRPGRPPRPQHDAGRLGCALRRAALYWAAPRLILPLILLTTLLPFSLLSPRLYPPPPAEHGRARHPAPRQRVGAERRQRHGPGKAHTLLLLTRSCRSPAAAVAGLLGAHCQPLPRTRLPCRRASCWARRCRRSTPKS